MKNLDVCCKRRPMLTFFFGWWFCNWWRKGIEIQLMQKIVMMIHEDLESQRNEQKMQIEVQFLGKPIFEAWMVPLRMSHPKCF